MVQFSKEIDRLPQTVYSAKKIALQELADIYQKEETSNLSCFIDKLCSKCDNAELNKKIRTILNNISQDDLLNLLDSQLSDINKEILIKHYSLDKNIKVYNKPMKLDDVAIIVNISSKKVSDRETRSLKTLIEYFRNLS